MQLIVVTFFGCDYQTVFNPLIASVALYEGNTGT